jgi:hypothetical protein
VPHFFARRLSASLNPFFVIVTMLSISTKNEKIRVNEQKSHLEVDCFSSGHGCRCFPFLAL